MDKQNFDYSINRSSLYEVIADRLEQMILNDLSSPEEPLPSEQILATGFGVSRPVIREALKILKERGLISQRQGGRTIVCHPSARHIANPLYRIMQLENIDPCQLFEIRISLEMLSVRQAASCAKEADITELNKLIDKMTKVKDQSEYAALDFAFHKRIAEIGENQILNIFIESIGELLKDMITASTANKNTISDGIAYHKRIADAIAAQNPESAESIMREHLTLFMRNYEQATC